MEPIGTITMYFPFLDDESRTLLQEIMDDANNYHDFVMCLNERVLNENVPDLAIYFAIHHSALLLDMDGIEAIGKKYGKLPILRPNLFYASVHQGNLDDLEKVHESADQVLVTDPPDWLAIEMRFLKFEADLLQYPKTLYDTNNLEKLEELIRSSPDFAFFENILYDCYRERAARDGDLEEKIRSTNQAIMSAENHDDLVRLAWHLRIKSDYLRSESTIEARDSLLRAYEVMDSLGNTAGIASTLLYLARLYATRGEYDQAIEQTLESIRIRESMDLPRGSNAILLSTLYNAAGDPNAGLEWARYAEIDFDSNPSLYPRAILNQAWSLILLGRKTEARVMIDTIHEDVMKSGLEVLLAWLYFITGVLDLDEGNTDSATSNIRNALELYEGKSAIEYALIFLYYLARIDVFQACRKVDKITSEGSLPWLTLLEERAKSDDLPGILGLSYILKARMALAINDNDSLRASVDAIRTLSREFNLTFLDSTLEAMLKSM